MSALPPRTRRAVQPKSATVNRNVADRLLYGYVLDFLNMSCCGINNPFVFNVADIFIFLGALGLILFDGDGKSRKKAP